MDNNDDEIPVTVTAPFPLKGESIVSMVNHNGRLLIATNAGVYEHDEGVWTRMKFVDAPPKS